MITNVGNLPFCIDFAVFCIPILTEGVGCLQEGLACKDGEHCAYAHDISALDIQLKSKIRKVRDYVALCSVRSPGNRSEHGTGAVAA